MVEIFSPLRDGHHAQVLALGVDVGASSSFHWPQELLSSELKAAKGWGFWIDDDLQAFVLWRDLGTEGEITVLATHPSKRRKGAMKTLLSHLFNACSYRAWMLEVHEENAPALCLYDELGFFEVGRRPRYYRDGRAAILLRWEKS